MPPLKTPYTPEELAELERKAWQRQERQRRLDALSIGAGILLALALGTGVVVLLMWLTGELTGAGSFTAVTSERRPPTIVVPLGDDDS